jgi:deoxyribodipyrimidine photo-lyase
MKELKNLNIFIFHRDLRTEDNKALHALIQLIGKGNKIVPIFIFNPKQIYAKNNPYFSNNAVQFMIESLMSLQKRCHLNYFEGDDLTVIESLHKKYRIKNIAYNSDYTPFARKRDADIAAWCQKNGINVVTAEDYTLLPMGTVKNNSGQPYKVFTPFYKNVLSKKIPDPLHSSIKFDQTLNLPGEKQIYIYKYYEHNPNIAVNGGRDEALKRLSLAKSNAKSYDKTRDYPGLDSTTKLSAYIKFGCISIREVHHAFLQNKGLIRELIWREFYANIMYHFPHVIGQSFKNKYDRIKWSENREWFEKWCKGQTGFPLVDAGMKQLNETGWMHNRVRMIVAMFLTKDLLIDWRWGEKYFATKLVDYDPASNNGGWQWSASTGTDAQPYFRIFSPELQLKKYDKNLEYVKRWNPGYKDIPPMIDHKERAQIAIKTFRTIA